jgi:hypothetical protein
MLQVLVHVFRNGFDILHFTFRTTKLINLNTLGRQNMKAHGQSFTAMCP